MTHKLWGYAHKKLIVLLLNSIWSSACGMSRKKPFSFMNKPSSRVFKCPNLRTHPVSQEETPNKRLILPEHEILIECDTFALCRVGECEWRRKTQIKTKKVLSFRLSCPVPIGVFIEASAPFSISLPHSAGVHQWNVRKEIKFRINLH